MKPFPQPPAGLPADVQKLMRDWASDPSWDLYDEEPGPFYDDYAAYQKACENWWDERRENELAEYAAKLYLSQNLPLAKHLMDLESRLSNLRDNHSKLYDEYMSHNHAESKRHTWSD